PSRQDVLRARPGAAAKRQPDGRGGDDLQRRFDRRRRAQRRRRRRRRRWRWRKRSVGRDGKPRTKVKAGRNSSSDVGSLRKLMQGRIHFDDDSDGDSVKGSPPPPPVAGRVPKPQSKRKGRHRRRRSNGSISSLMEVESAGIVGSSIPSGPPAAAAAAGTGVVARAVARVEEGPPVVGDGAAETKKAMK
ncbi:unnamed protein product, partial [Ectocarpus sp. 8 AP-2014]